MHTGESMEYETHTMHVRTFEVEKGSDMSVKPQNALK